jgi:hypothetical protein
MTGLTSAARTALVGTLVAAAIGLAPNAAGAAHEEYVAFVTDFPKPVTSTATPEPFVPFVTDFPDHPQH